MFVFSKGTRNNFIKGYSINRQAHSRLTCKVYIRYTWVLFLQERVEQMIKEVQNSNEDLSDDRQSELQEIEDMVRFHLRSSLILKYYCCSS
jgi:hypothetical protein